MIPYQSILPAVLLSLCTFVVAAQSTPVYRWHDASGKVHYGQVPPHGVEHELILPGNRAKVTVLDSERDEADDTGLAGDAEAFLAQAEKERAEKEKAKAEAKRAKLVAQQKCDASRERAQFLEERTARRLVIKADDGNYARMQEDEFLRRLEDAKKGVVENCQ